MGGNQNNPFREGGQLMSEFIITNKNQELFLTYLTHRRTQKQYILRELTYNEQRQYTINYQKVKNRKNIKNKHLTHLERIDERNEDNMCSNFLKLYTLWEFSNKSLLDEIKERGLQRKPFENMQLWSILACSIMGLAALQQKDIRHQCLTTKAILMESDGNVKIVDPMALGFQTNFQCVFNNRTLKNVYLSPQQCEAIESQKPIINKNPFKNDVFTLGMILLECGLLERQDQCYLDDCSRINWSKVQANIAKFGSLYQQDLKQMLIIMLGKDIRSRPDWLDLDKFVKKNNNKNSSKFISETSSRKRDYFIKRTVQNSLQPHKQNKISPQNNRSHPHQYQVSKFYGLQPINNNLYQPQKLNGISQNIHGYAIPSYNHISSETSQKNIPNEYYFHQKQPDLAKTGTISFVPGSSSINPLQNRILSSNYPYSLRPNTFDTNGQFKQTIQSIYYSDQSKAKQFTYNPVPTMIQPPRSSSHFPNYSSNYYSLANYPLGNNSVNNYPPNNYVFNNHSSLSPVQQPQNFRFNNILTTGLPNLLEQKNNIPKRYQNSLQNNELIHNTGQQDHNNYSPINISSYIRPAQSVNYQVIKAYSPISQQQNKNDTVTYPFDPKIPMTPQMSEKNLLQSQPQYVEEHFKMGSRYEGYKLNGLRHGKGKFYYQDGGSYDGEWNQNKMEGFGTLYYQSNRKAFEGMWLNDQFQGKGKLYNQNPAQFQQFFDFNDFDEIDQYWQYYQGNFNADEKDGQGKLKFSNGQLFQGIFKKDMVEGEGTFYCKDGRKINGIWSQNHLVTILN